MTQNNGTSSSPLNMICAEEYVVKRGDSFYLISHKLGVPLRDLLAANRDIHPARLMVGDVLCIPREEDDAVVQSNYTMQATYPTVPSGNGATNGNGTNATAESNGAGATEDAQEGNDMNGSEEIPMPSCPIEEQLTVQSGQTVADIQLGSLVSRNTLTTANPSVDLDNLQAGQVLCVPQENIPCPIPSTYTLCSADTLETVAIRYNLPVAAILRANPCLAPQDFEPGVTVILPR